MLIVVFEDFDIFLAWYQFHCTGFGFVVSCPRTTVEFILKTHNFIEQV